MLLPAMRHVKSILTTCQIADTGVLLPMGWDRSENSIPVSKLLSGNSDVNYESETERVTMSLLNQFDVLRGDSAL